MKELICKKCGVPMEMTKVAFRYLGHDMDTDVPCCPVCGQVFLPRELVEGKMAETEGTIEDK